MIIDAPMVCDIPSLRGLWKDVFGDTDDFLDAFFTTAFSVERSRCVKIDGRICAMLYWFDCEFNSEKIAYIYAVATAEEYRGRGICRRMMENTHDHLATHGYFGTILVPVSVDLFGFYEKLGYQKSSYVKELTAGASDRIINIDRISVGEYAALRRKLLPLDSVIQENENIIFLQTMADFFAGDGFILAANIENGVLHGIEFLGDEELLPSLVGSLGCKKGIFRTNGREKAFAMYRSLVGDALSVPSYFGLAFD